MKIKYLLFGVLLLCASSFAAEKAAIKEASSTGVTVIRNKQATENIQVGFVLEVGDEIRTNPVAFADILYPDQSLAHLGHNTQFVIQKLEHKQNIWIAIHDLIKGYVRGMVQKMESPKSDVVRFQVHTKTGTIGVRGTDFVVSYDSATSKTSLHTLEGAVLFAAPKVDFSDTKQVLLVNAGMTSESGKNKKPSQPQYFDIEKYKKSLEDIADFQFSANASDAASATKETAADIAKTDKPELTDQKKKIQNCKEKLEKKLNDVNKSIAVLEQVDKKIVDEQIAQIKEKIDANLKAADLETSAIVQKCLADGVNINITVSDRKITALMIAAIGGLYNTARLLKDSGADKSLKNSDGKTALDLARDNNQRNIVNLLQ